MPDSNLEDKDTRELIEILDRRILQASEPIVVSEFIKAHRLHINEDLLNVIFTNPQQFAEDIREIVVVALGDVKNTLSDSTITLTDKQKAFIAEPDSMSTIPTKSKCTLFDDGDKQLQNSIQIKRMLLQSLLTNLSFESINTNLANGYDIKLEALIRTYLNELPTTDKRYMEITEALKIKVADIFNKLDEENRNKFVKNFATTLDLIIQNCINPLILGLSREFVSDAIINPHNSNLVTITFSLTYVFDEL